MRPNRPLTATALVDALPAVVSAETDPSAAQARTSQAAPRLTCEAR
jgi:hypothetical protein